MAGGKKSIPAAASRGGAQGGEDARAQPAGEPGPGPAAEEGQQQDAQPSQQSAAASSGAQGGGAAGGGRPVKQPQLDLKSLKEAKEAFSQYCRGQPQAIQKLADEGNGSRRAHLYVAKVLLMESCTHATAGKQLPEVERDLQDAAHGALDRVVSAATHEQQPSLLGAAYATMLLRMLEGQAGVEERRRQWQRLANRFPLPLREQLTAFHFVPPEQEAVAMGSAQADWPLDVSVLEARNRAPASPDGLPAWAAKQIAELQQLLSTGMAADVQAFEKRELAIQELMRRPDDVMQSLGPEAFIKLAGQLSVRFAQAKYMLPGDPRNRLATRLQLELRAHTHAMQEVARVQQEKAHRQQQQRLQHLQQMRQHARQLLEQAGGLSEQERQQLLNEVGRAGVKAAQLTTFLSSQLEAAPVPAGLGGSRIGRIEERQVSALLGLARMPLGDVMQHVRAAAAEAEAQPTDAAASGSQAATSFEPVLQALASVLGGHPQVEYTLPVAAAAGSSDRMSRREFEQTILHLTCTPEWLSTSAELIKQAGLEGILQCPPLANMPASLPAEMPAHLHALDEDQLDIPVFLDLHPDAHPSDAEVLLEVPPWRGRAGGGAPAAAEPPSTGHLRCTGDAPVQLLFSVQGMIQQAATLLEDLAQDAGSLLRLFRAQTAPQLYGVDECLAKVLAGHLMLVAAMDQEEAEYASGAGRPGSHASGGSIGGWRDSFDSDSDATDVEAEGPQPSAARSPCGGISAERAERLAYLQHALDGPGVLALKGMLAHCIPDPSARLRGSQQATHMLRAASEPPHAFYPIEEGGHLLLHLFPLQQQLPKLAAVGNPLPSAALIEAREAAVDHILSALRLLQSRGRLPLLLSHIVQEYLNVAAEHRGVPLPEGAGSEAAPPFAVLGQLSLRDLLNLYSFLCTWLANTFAAGPVELGPDFEEAIVMATAGSKLVPPAQQAAVSVTEGWQDAQLSLTQFGLCQLASEAGLNEMEQLDGDLRAVRLHRRVRQRIPAEMPSPVHCTESLAHCASGLGAALDAVVTAAEPRGSASVLGLLEEQDRELMLSLQHLAMVRWWQELLHRSIMELQPEQESLTRAVRMAARLAQTDWQGLADAEPAVVRAALAGVLSRPSPLQEAAQLCFQAGDTYGVAMGAASMAEVSLAALASHASATDVRRQALWLAERAGPERQDGLVRTRAIVERAERKQRDTAAALHDLMAAAQGNLPAPAARERLKVLLRHQEELQRLRVAAAGCTTAPQLAALARLVTAELQKLHLSLQDIEASLLQAGQTLLILHWAAVNQLHALLGSLRFKSASSPLAVLTRQLVELALPRRWEEQMKAQQAQQKQQKLAQQAQQAGARRASPAGAEALPPLPPEVPQAGKGEAPSAPPLPSAPAAARSGSAGTSSSSSSQAPERGGRGQGRRKAKVAAPAAAAEQQKELSAAEAKERQAAYDALLKEAEQEEKRKKEKEAKQKQKEEDKKRKAAQAKAAQAAAEAKRKAEEEAAAKAAAARAAEEARLEAERERQEEEERVRKQNLDALKRDAEEVERRAAAAVIAPQRAATAETQRAQQGVAAAAGGSQAEGEQPLAAATPQPKPGREQRGSRQGRRQDKPAADAGESTSAAAAAARVAPSIKQPAAASHRPAATVPSVSQAAAAAAEPETPAPSAAAAGKRRGSGAVAEHRPASPETAADQLPAEGQQARGAAPASVQPAAAQQAQQGKGRRKPKAPSPQPEEAAEQRPGRAPSKHPSSQALPPPPPQQQKQQRQAQQEPQARQPQAAQPGRRGRGRGEQRDVAEQAPAWHSEVELQAVEMAGVPLGPDGFPDMAALDALIKQQEARDADRVLAPPPAAAAVPGGWAAGAAAAEAPGGRQSAAHSRTSQVAAPAGAPGNRSAAPAAPVPASRGRQLPAEQPAGTARFTSWIGAWVCACGKQHGKISESCNCGRPDPCRNWFYGEPCKVSHTGQCSRPHLLFDLPSRPSRDDYASTHKLRPLELKPDPKFVYKPPPKPAASAARPRSQAAPPAREQPATSAAAGGQRPGGPAVAVAGPAAGAAGVPGGPRPAWPRPPAQRATAARSGSAGPATAPRPESAPDPQQQLPVISTPAPLPRGYQPATELPGVASLFPPLRQPPTGAQGAAAAHPPRVPAGVPAVAAAVPEAAAADDLDMEHLLLDLGVGSGSLEQQAQAPVAAPLLPGLVPNSAGWGGGSSAASAPALQQQQHQQQLPWEALQGAGGWGAPGQAAGPAVVEASLELQQQGGWSAGAETQEDAEFQAEVQAAIRASLETASASAVQHQAGAWQQVGGHGQQQAAAGAAAEAGDELSLAGMRNEAGEYNCFINVIIQCLWRCAEFRHQVASWDADFRGADPVLEAVFGLFQQFEAQEAARRANAPLVPVDPTPLREALAALPGHNFRVGEMNDAAEVLLCIYEKAMDVAKAQGRSSGIEETFGLKVHEAVNCGACRRVTQQNQYTQYFHNTQATMLRELRGSHGALGTLLAHAEAQHLKSCDVDVGGCGQANPVTHVLQAAPRVFTLQVAWESHNEAPQDIAATLAAIRETVDLGEVYSGVPRGVHRYVLRSMVCYYGAHYQALVLVPDAGGWLMFDDTRVSRVGDWQAVRRKCEAGRIQPSVLFYEAG